MKHLGAEAWFAVAGMAACVAVDLAVLGALGDFYLENLVSMLLPQALILGMVAAFNVRPALLAAVGFVLAGYLFAYVEFVVRASPDGLAWIGYWLTLLGAALSSLLIGAMSRRWKAVGAATAAAVTTLVLAGGVLVTQALVFASAG